VRPRGPGNEDGFVSELPEKISQTLWSNVGSILSTISYRGLCLNYLQKISQT
jgi:hypothetical protein